MWDKLGGISRQNRHSSYRKGNWTGGELEQGGGEGAWGSDSADIGRIKNPKE